VFAKLFSREWLLSTILVIAASGVMARLGVWQLDRLEQRRSFNVRVVDQIEGGTVDINSQGLGESLFDMEFRPAVVRGEYILGKHILLTNQVSGIELGSHVLTPLQIDGSPQVILVNRGWVSADINTNEQLDGLTPAGTVELEGIIRRSQTEPPLNLQADAPLSPGEAYRLKWRLANLGEIEKQIPGVDTSVFFQIKANFDVDAVPLPQQPEIEITEGPHLGYAIQWFIFSLLVLAGYPVFVRKQSQK